MELQMPSSLASDDAIGASTLNITVLGLWHLGCVTAACCAQHFQVSGLALEFGAAAELASGKTPIFEPGLDSLIQAGLQSGRLRFSCEPSNACALADILWVTYDTPVDDNDRPDVASVLEAIAITIPHLPAKAVILLSSQLPAGTCANLERNYPGRVFLYSPENLRLGRAIDAFTKAERVVVGMRNDAANKKLMELLFSPFTTQIIFMRTESAEMVKHALNSFLAVSISFINEIGRLCEHLGADVAEVSAGLKSDPRIGSRAYLGAGGPFAGGTLARDVVSLRELGEAYGEPLTLIPAIKESNDKHRGWTLSKLRSQLPSLTGKKVVLFGLTYTPHTDTLRRSGAVELFEALFEAGATVFAVDPAVKTLASRLQGLTLAQPDHACSGAHAIIICTEWPEFRELPWPQLLASTASAFVIDSNRFLGCQMSKCLDTPYFSVGHSL